MYICAYIHDTIELPFHVVSLSSAHNVFMSTYIHTYLELHPTWKTHQKQACTYVHMRLGGWGFQPNHMMIPDSSGIHIPDRTRQHPTPKYLTNVPTLDLSTVCTYSRKLLFLPRTSSDIFPHKTSTNGHHLAFCLLQQNRASHGRFLMHRGLNSMDT